MSNYSRYGSYFLANEKDVDENGQLNIKAKPINRKRHDFVNDTDPDNFADNISDEDLPEDELAPEGFPMGDISDEPDDPSDNIPQFPDDVSDELEELDDMDSFPTDDTENLDNELEDFPTGSEEDLPEFPDDSSPDDVMNDFPDDGGGDTGEDSLPSDNNASSSGAISDGKGLLDDILKKVGNKKLPTPDEIIDDLRKKVYSENPPEATQTNINNSDIPDFPTDSAENGTTNVDTGLDNTMGNFPGNEQNPMATTPDMATPNFPGDANQTMPVDNTMGATPDMGAFPGDTTMNPNPAQPGMDMAGGTNINTATTDDMGFPGDTDFAAGAGTGLPGTDAGMGGQMGQMGGPGQPPPGPGVGYDSMRKYNLYKEYNRLLEAIGNYTSRLENLMFDEPHQNLIVKTVIDKLNEVKKLCYDYITMKFEIASYAQSYVFFEELAVSIQVIFTILMTISSYNTDDNDGKQKKNKKANKNSNKK